ncbi:MAG: NAD(P)H-dependent flavin oxidoreductase, partial [Solimonas sp.]
LALGADGVNMGTRFMLTRECAIHDNVKQALIGASELDTTLIKRTLKRTARFYSNATSREIVALEQRPGGATFDDIQHLLSGKRGRVAIESGDIDGGLVCASQVIGLIDDIPTCAELVARMVSDCRARLDTARNAFRD